jgi:hypothetical protein
MILVEASVGGRACRVPFVPAEADPVAALESTDLITENIQSKTETDGWKLFISGRSTALWVSLGKDLQKFGTVVSWA